jgi:hypothetical protein
MNFPNQAEYAYSGTFQKYITAALRKNDKITLACLIILGTIFVFFLEISNQ